MIQFKNIEKVYRTDSIERLTLSKDYKKRIWSDGKRPLRALLFLKGLMPSNEISISFGNGIGGFSNSF